MRRPLALVFLPCSLSILLLALVLPLPAGAQPFDEPPAAPLSWSASAGVSGPTGLTKVVPANNGACGDGLIYDDGNFENGYASTSSFFTHLNMQFEPLFAPARLQEACVCWRSFQPNSSFLDFDLVIWAADGPGGDPGTALGIVPGLRAPQVPEGGRFYRYDLSGLELVTDQPVYIGPRWDSGEFEGFFVCADEGPRRRFQPGYFDAGLFAGLLPPDVGIGNIFPDYRALGVRATFEQEMPPATAPLLSSEFPDFRFWVRISTPEESRMGTVADSLCASETLCVAGAIPTRSEVEIRIIGPRPNGFLWPTIVKFTTSRVQVWIEQISSGELEYYDLEGASPGNDVLEGLFDRTGFRPR